jgi:hypothetical protein
MPRSASLGRRLRDTPRTERRSPDRPTLHMTAIRLRAILGDPAVDAVVAVRRLEDQQYAGLDSPELADKFRMAWSV